MSAPQDPQQQQAAPAAPGGQMLEDPAAVTNALLIACRRAAEAGAAAQDNRDIQAASAAALAFAQAIVVLDPTLDQQGVPLDHHAAIAQMQRAAAAPTPARSGQADVK